MKALFLSLILLTACGAEENKNETSPTADSWSQDGARDNSEQACRVNYYGDSLPTAATMAPCSCLQEEIEKRWSYSEFKAQQFSNFQTLTTDGTAARCQLPLKEVTK